MPSATVWQTSKLLNPIQTYAKNTGSAKALYQLFSDSLMSHADLLNGGLKGAPKFPNPAFIEFMLLRAYVSKDDKALDIVTTALNKMAVGGIYDQLEGGFARYTTDSAWRSPHFEKMLYDNAQMISIYAQAYQFTKNEFYKKVFTETLAFVEENMAAPGGGYYSSINADSKTGEGKYYLWSEQEFNAAVTNDKMIGEYFHITNAGNWETGNNVYMPRKHRRNLQSQKKQIQ